MVICVYSSSSNHIDKIYHEAAYQLGCEIAKRGDTFLYGGGQLGLMGQCAKGVHDSNGKVIGIIPEALNIKGVVYDYCDELIVTEDMRTRKKIMDERSDAIIALPGGFGTLEELLEMITLKQLNYHNKPIAILNTQGFYDELMDTFEKLIELNFARPTMKSCYYVNHEIKDILNYIDQYQPIHHPKKWENQCACK